MFTFRMPHRHTRTTPRNAAWSCLAFGVAAACSAHADTWFRTQELGAAPIPATPSMQFGASIAVDSVLDGQLTYRRLYVGAPREQVNGLAEAGAVFVYTRGANGWTYAQTVTAHLPKAGAHFGAHLVVGSGHNLLVSAPDYDNGSGTPGSGYVEFLLDSGANVVSTQTLVGTPGTHLGRALAISHDMAALSWTSTSGGCVAGMRYSTATQHWDYFPATHPQVCESEGAALGASLAIHKTSDSAYLLIAGAPASTQGGQALAGNARVYFPNGDSLLQIDTLAADTPAFLDAFGTSVGIDADYVYVGASGRDNGAGRVGSVTVFKPATIIGYDNLTEVFPQTNASIGGHCGATLAVDSSQSGFIIGCPDSDDLVADEGYARVYRPLVFLGTTVWLESLLRYGDGIAHGADRLGSSVALFGDHAFVGAPSRDTLDITDRGALEIFATDLIFRNSFNP